MAFGDERDIARSRVLNGPREVPTGAIQLPEALQRAIDRQVQDGRAAKAVAFLEEPVTRLIDDSEAEDDDIQKAALAGITDAEAGRFTTIASPEDRQRFHDRMVLSRAARKAVRDAAKPQ